MKLSRKILEIIRDENGTETVEWGIVAGLLVGVLILTLAAIGTWVNGAFTSVKTKIGA